MAKKISKLTIGEIVKTFGEKALRKLTPEGGLPLWNGTDLTGTIWVLKGGWTTDGSIGAVSINGVFLFGNSYYSTGRINFREMEFQPQKIIFRNDESSESITATYSTDKTMRFVGGEGATNPLLISFFKQYGQLTSHQMPTPNLITFTIDGTTYQAEEGMNWYDWANSKYNTPGYECPNIQGYIASHGWYIRDSNYRVIGTQLITNGYAYSTEYDGGGSND